MARDKGNNRNIRKSRPAPARPKHASKGQASLESRAAEAVTTVWVLTVVMGLLCNVGAAGARLYAQYYDPQTVRIAILAGLLLFAASTLGVVALALLPCVLKMRRQPPPRGFVFFSLAVAAAPLVVAALSMAA